MDYEEKKRRQFWRVLIAEVGMTISVVAIVAVTMLAAMGFFISGDGQIEQSGLLQLHSVPTGAAVEIDGTAVFSRTNLSRTLSAGKHEIKLSREGFDSWTKTITMQSGILMRLYYPRLFLQNRTQEPVYSFGTNKNLEFYAPSRSRNYILYMAKGADEWHLLDIRGDEMKETVIPVGAVLPGMKENAVRKATDTRKTYQFLGAIKEVVWSGNDEKILVRVAYNETEEWVLVNLRDTAQSLNLTKKFGFNFSEVRMIDRGMNQLFVLENTHLRKINVGEKVISGVLLSGVKRFENLDSKIVYVTDEEIGAYRDGDEKGVAIAEVTADAKVKVVIAKFFDEDYISYYINQNLTILYGDAADVAGLKVLSEEKLEVQPETLTLSPGSEYLVMTAGRKNLVIDFYTADMFEYETSGKWKWLDGSMMYRVENGRIIAWDFDNTNLRDLTEGVQKIKYVAEETVTINANNVWMYYPAFNQDVPVIVREKIR